MTAHHFERHQRYQYQSWWVKRWRDRYLLRVPWHAFRTWCHQFKSQRPLPWKHCWSIERGMADVFRGYLYDSSELTEDLKPKGGPP